MPILKSLIPGSDEEVIKAPDSGAAIRTEQNIMVNAWMGIMTSFVALIILIGCYCVKMRH